MNKVVHGYRPTSVKCPYCGGSHGAVGRTEDPRVFQYQCWCGATAKIELEAGETEADLP